MPGSSRKVMLGLGNLLLSDEGFGIHALRHLRTHMDTNVRVECIDGGVLGLSLLPLVLECSHLLVLDAIDGGQPPGTLIELGSGTLPYAAAIKLSEHQVGFQEVLEVSRFRGDLPTNLHIIGVQPKSMVLGTQLSAEVASTIPQIKRRAQAILRKWGLD